MIQAVPTQSKQGMLPDECRAVDNNEPKGQNEIAATTSAVDDDRTTPVTEAASIPASELVHQNSQGHAERGIKRRGGARVAERPWRQVNKEWSKWNWKWLEPGRDTSKVHALSQKILFRRGVKLMAAWRKLSVNSAVARERDKKVARNLGWNSSADENIDSEACEPIDSDDSEYLEYVRELEERCAL